MTYPDDDIEERINEFFEDNFATLKMEGGHTLSPEVKETARQQALMYWRKLREVAERVTDTEVRLNLPGQTTPQGRTFGIDGVVDIVREDERVVMYDIKTHAAAAIRADIGPYERQLNVYAHIWQNLRGQRLDQTTIICTQLPDGLKAALSAGDERRVEYELERWSPLIEVPFDPRHVEETIRDFGAVVDQIEDGEFAPPPLDRLVSRQPGTNALFAVNVCRNCDARFSCASYRAYARQSSRGVDQRFRQYLDDFGGDAERSERVLASLPTS
jgi:hypothetical protein